ncbi:hypothetical protein ABMY26_32125 [Azospirillum sp. HJ39]|uniref:hypothetical protein n=1 Tax=Azospirillum sp. HJ39 TaxID=3159496 RepID=UPI0035579177
MSDRFRNPALPESAAGERRLRQMQREILYWLRRTIGEQMGRSGEAAIATVTGGMRVTHLIPAASDLEAVQAAIKLRWGVALTIRGATTVADMSSVILVGMKGGTAK